MSDNVLDVSTVQLVELAHARSGDKGDVANIGVIAYQPEDYALLERVLTPQRVKEHLAEMVEGEVVRYELPHLHALNFVLHQALGGGGTVSLRTDAQGKVFSTALLRMRVQVPPEVAERVHGQGRVPSGFTAASAAERATRTSAPEEGTSRQRRNPLPATASAVGSRQPHRTPPAGGAEGGQVLRAVEDGVGVLTLNRPRKRNALDSGMVEALGRAFAMMDADPGVRVVLLRAAGPDFCAGADVADLERVAAMGPAQSHADAARMASLFTQMRRTTKPVVAAVHGRALGGGCGLATACDVILVREDAELGYPEVHLGFVPALVLVLLRRKVSETRAFELATLGERFSAADALAWGLATRVLPTDGFERAAAGYAKALAKRPPSSVALSKRLLYDLGECGFDEGMARAVEVNVRARLTRSFRRGVRRFLARRKR